MDSVKKLLKASKAFKRSTQTNSFLTIMFVLLIVFDLILVIPFCIYLFSNKDQASLSLNFFFAYGIVSMYSMIMFSYSGFSVFSSSAWTIMAEKNDLLKSTFFLPFTKNDYIKATMLVWCKCFLFFAIPSCINILICSISQISDDLKNMTGASIAVNSICLLISGIFISISLFVKRSKKAAGVLCYIGYEISMLPMIFFLILQFINLDKFKFDTFSFFCTPLGIVCVLIVIPVVLVFTAITAKLNKNKSWFNE